MYMFTVPVPAEARTNFGTAVVIQVGIRPRYDSGLIAAVITSATA
jgi:hypothetical protein